MGDTPSAPARSCWVVTDGKIGTEVQCLGLAEALGFDPAVKRIDVRRPWRWLAPMVLGDPLDHLGPGGDGLAAPWPDVLVSCGRQAIAPSIAVRRASGGRTFTIQIQRPMLDPGRFDAVVAPKHDRLSGPNVIATIGSLNRITPERLSAAATRVAPRVDGLPRPLVAVLLGGDNRVYHMTPGIVRRLGDQLADMARQHDMGLLITPSRRTGAGRLDVLSEALTGVPTRIWDGRGENPYLGYLALADAIVVTADSVNMVCEAATTGKPVHVVDLQGGSDKFRRFHDTMRAMGITRPFDGRLETWTYQPLRDTERAAAEVRHLLELRRAAVVAPAASLSPRAPSSSSTATASRPPG